MKKNNIFRIFSFISVLVSFVSCTERIDIDTGTMENKVVIYGELCADKDTQFVSVRFTAPYFSKEDNKNIENAIVTISSGEKEWNLSYVKDGLYRTDEKMQPLEGQTYNLKVECDYNNDGVKDIYTANATIPVSLPLDRVEFIKDKMIYDIYGALIYTDIPKNGRYCLYKFYNKDSLLTPNLSDYLIADVKLWNKNGYIEGLRCYNFFDLKDRDKIVDDDDDDGFIFVTPGDEITLEMSMIDKGYYDFINQCQTELHGENPMFGGPPSNIITNISNGGYGYWGATNNSRESNIIP